MRQEPFVCLDNGEFILAPVRALRLDKYILKYMEMNTLQESAATFSSKAHVVEMSGGSLNVGLKTRLSPRLVNHISVWVIQTYQHPQVVVEDDAPLSVLDDIGFSFKEFFTVYKEAKSFRSNSDGELRLWNLDRLLTIYTLKEDGVGIKKVRFKLNNNLLVVSLGKMTLGHVEDVKSICWNHGVDALLASLSWCSGVETDKHKMEV
ncbi:hypothetical protein L1987_63893 [Smallanthus sonchifolius]|uniref:Uncharacterized protein n=1 Tax=Smallanthus sonchifolius TaxID=185202 RepID=A0ACB9CEK7_9ASTR|nr:hypothetical protein L1987_63893 [Smallanthus sonchifolius]